MTEQNIGQCTAMRHLVLLLLVTIKTPSWIEMISGNIGNQEEDNSRS